MLGVVNVLIVGVSVNDATGADVFSIVELGRKTSEVDEARKEIVDVTSNVSVKVKNSAVLVGSTKVGVGVLCIWREENGCVKVVAKVAVSELVTAAVDVLCTCTVSKMVDVGCSTRVEVAVLCTCKEDDGVMKITEEVEASGSTRVLCTCTVSKMVDVGCSTRVEVGVLCTCKEDNGVMKITEEVEASGSTRVLCTCTVSKMVDVGCSTRVEVGVLCTCKEDDGVMKITEEVEASGSTRVLCTCTVSKMWMLAALPELR